MLPSEFTGTSAPRSTLTEKPSGPVCSHCRRPLVRVHGLLVCLEAQRDLYEAIRDRLTAASMRG